MICIFWCMPIAFSALTMLVGWQEGHPACKNWLMRCWCGYLSEVRCKWFACGPADATATPSSLAPVKSRLVYLSGAGLPRLSGKKTLNRRSVVHCSSYFWWFCTRAVWVIYVLYKLYRFLTGFHFAKFFTKKCSEYQVYECAMSMATAL